MTNSSNTPKVALVTDASHFVGPPSLRALTKAGFTCLAVDDSFADPETRAGFEAGFEGVTALSPDTPEALIGAIEHSHGRLDALVSNDAYPADRVIYFEEDLSALDAKFKQAVDRIVTRPFALIAAAARLMKKTGGGRVVAVSSAAPLQGLVNYSVYVAARGAQNGMIRTLALELGPHNITINALAPNFVKSPTYFPDELLNNPEIHTKIVKNIPVGRLGEPAEAGETIAFLAGDHGGFITGHVLPFSGGWA